MNERVEIRAQIRKEIEDEKIKWEADALYNVDQNYQEVQNHLEDLYLKILNGLVEVSARDLAEILHESNEIKNEIADIFSECDEIPYVESWKIELWAFIDRIKNDPQFFDRFEGVDRLRFELLMMDLIEVGLKIENFLEIPEVLEMAYEMQKLDIPLLPMYRRLKHKLFFQHHGIWKILHTGKCIFLRVIAPFRY